ncbi:phosphoprotein phosphatase [Enhygromyxa salina]|uniref:Phosphoprotein phosphatase n=1 Tax=Enhygromyxa salina TaxID=215803 RepID=A0A0C1Z5C0_9BACT|nr:phosphoprotein phosphatase [Enhygromyxa salina]
MAPLYDKLLVLDLDETLVHGTTEPLERPPDYQVGEYAIYRRPGVSEFLERCFERFEVGVWTASTLSYAHPVLAQLTDPARFAFVWGRGRCTLRCDPETRDYEQIKDIRKLRRAGYARAKIIFVDDTPANIARSYGNYVQISPYLGALEDTELAALALYLDDLGPHPNIRGLEKRGWRRR